MNNARLRLAFASGKDNGNHVSSRAVPFFLIAGASRYHTDSYRFQRDEIDAWTIG